MTLDSPLVRQAILALLCVLGLGSCGAAAISPLLELIPLFPMNVVVVFAIGLSVAGAAYYAWQRWLRGRSPERVTHAAIGSRADWLVCLAAGAIAGVAMGSVLEPSSGGAAHEYGGVPSMIGFVVGLCFSACAIQFFRWIDVENEWEGNPTRGVAESDPAV